ncbi:hypothetical protein BFW38_10345 [Terasakiispira papahanaumokuakeensis]|uniref:Uncharacterized protein n=1 Tax=Terasakiispira papahanaumokuakeensis TaxID=197479 RepID=A0A1E2VAM6_9GAMM|nr:hypothetical protein [Terasakiispira papahanaumokuakeensis]ODC03886.1 hypothetical protein BFW38_10345 [Terasakiispira papahanaumokuakeensis]
MTDFEFHAWWAYAASGLVLLLASWRILRGLPFTLWLGILLSELVCLVVPAPIGPHTEQVAPAVIVALLEMMAQGPQAGLPILIMMIAALLAAWGIALLVGWWRRYRMVTDKADAD